MAQIDRQELIHYLDVLLESTGCPDMAPNGLQVEGRSEIAKLVTGVSACRELFVRAKEAGADGVLVHHGIFWSGFPYPLTGVQYGRVEALIRAGLNLIAYHLPLDRHSELGNNILAAHQFGLKDIQSFGVYEGTTIGFKGALAEPASAADLQQRCAQIFGQHPVHFGPDDRSIRTVGIVSGGAQSILNEAIDEGLDAFITGESSEWVMNLAREAGIHFFAAGHYATERLGIQALGDHLRDKFALDVEFIDIPNPV